MKTIFKIILLLGIVSSCKESDKTEANTSDSIIRTRVVLTQKQFDNAAIRIGMLEEKNISNTITSNGKIELPPQNQISIGAPFGGFVKSTKLIPGMSVKKGDVLFVMEDPQYIQLQQDYLTAKAKFAYDESEYKRQKNLNETKATSDKVFEQAKAAFQSEYVLIKSLEEKLKLIGLTPSRITADNISSKINIPSPIDGYVASIHVNVGKYVAPNDILAELINTQDLLLSLTIFEKDAIKLAIGQKVMAFTNAENATQFPATVQFITKNVSQDNSIDVTCKFDTSPENILPGMFMNAVIDLERKQTKALPEEAIVDFNGKKYVFIETAHLTYEMMEVQTGATENGFTEMSETKLLNGQKIVCNGAYSLLMALKNVSEE